MKSKTSEGIGRSTKEYIERRKYLEKENQHTSKLGTYYFDILEVDHLILDMEQRYREGEILSVFDYKALLYKHKNDQARIKVLRNENLF